LQAEGGVKMAKDYEFPLHNDTSRKIIHIDMDAFFASVEIRDNPKLQGKPVVIARHPKETGGRGVVSTASYEARKYGIHSAMSAREAYDLCPQAVFIPGNYEKYRAISKQVREIFHRYTDVVEPVSIDEAYLDVTENKIHTKSAMKVAKCIQYDIYHELQLTCSAGVSYNKFLAKLASDYEKPHGMTVIQPKDAVDFLKSLPIEKFHGVGKKTVERMHEIGVYTGADLYELSEMTLIRKFGSMGYSLYQKVRGVHNSKVQPRRERKSVGKERTYGQVLTNAYEVERELTSLSEKVELSLRKVNKHGHTVVIKVRNSDFETKTMRRTVEQFVVNKADIYEIARELFDEVVEGDQFSIRLLGITVTNLSDMNYEEIVLPLWKK
jgi:DNA polymerase-4